MREGFIAGTALLGPRPQLSLCLDLDECAFPGICPTGVCTNTVGSFSCKDCDQGYRPSPLGNSCEGKRPLLRGESMTGLQWTNQASMRRNKNPTHIMPALVCRLQWLSSTEG